MQQIKTTAIFINAKKYDFQNDNNENVKGASINVLLPNNSLENNPNLIGIDVSKIKIPFDLFDKLVTTKPLQELVLICELVIGAKKVDLSLVSFEKAKV